jgi:hypothetical protein
MVTVEACPFLLPSFVRQQMRRLAEETVVKSKQEKEFHLARSTKLIQSCERFAMRVYY